MNPPINALELILRGIKVLDDAQLRQLNSEVVQMIRANHARKMQTAARQFYVGDLVEFVDKNGAKHRMRIERINAKTMSVKGVDNPRLQGRVSPTLCRLVGA